MRAVWLGGNNDNFHVNANDNLNNNDNPSLGIASTSRHFFTMKTYNNLWSELCSWDNLQVAYWNARKGKTLSTRVGKFDKQWRFNLAVLLWELRTKTYKPRSLSTFVLRDPKTRVISVADFRDRVVHHALINVLQPIFEPRFIADSFANRKGKGTLKALDRFDFFKRKLLVDAIRGGDIGLNVMF